MIVFRRQAECLYTGIIAKIETTVNYGAYAETSAESIAQDILILFLGAELGHTAVDFRKRSGHRLSESEEVTVVVNEYGKTEFLLKERSQCHTVAEAGEIGQEAAHDTIGIIGRTLGMRMK